MLTNKLIYPTDSKISDSSDIAAVIDTEKVIEKTEPFPLMTHIVQSVLFGYMSLQEMRDFCKALEMKEEETKSYIEEYQNKLFAQVEKEGFESPSENSDIRLFNLHQAFIKIAAKATDEAFDEITDEAFGGITDEAFDEITDEAFGGITDEAFDEKATKILSSAIKKGDYWVAIFAIKHKANIHNLACSDDASFDSQESSLHAAAKALASSEYREINAGRIEILRFLLTQPGININAEDSNCFTALFSAAMTNNVEGLKLLLAHPGIKINHSDYTGHTALHQSVDKGCLESTRFLLNTPGIDIYPMDEPKGTPFWLAIEKGYIEIVRLFLDNPLFDINHVSGSRKETALTFATKLQTLTHNYKEIVQLLLIQPDIIVFYPDKFQKDALENAITYEKPEIISLIHDYVIKHEISEGIRRMQEYQQKKSVEKKPQIIAHEIETPDPVPVKDVSIQQPSTPLKVKDAIIALDVKPHKRDEQKKNELSSTAGTLFKKDQDVIDAYDQQPKSCWGKSFK